MNLAKAIGSSVVTCAVGWCALGATHQAPPQLPSSALPVELLGVMAVGPRSSCLVRCTYPEEPRRTSTVEVGQTACDLAEIREVRQDAVVVRNLLTNRVELLTFWATDAPASAPARTKTEPAPAPTVVRTSPGLVNVQLRQDSVERYLANLPDLLSSAVATPRHLDAGSGPRPIEGFQIDRIKKGSVVEQMGIENGDVVLELNGEKLDGLASVIRLFAQAQSMPQATMAVLRKGERLTFVFKTK